jgi:ATP-dependent Lon protease
LSPEEIFFGFALEWPGAKREPEEIFFGFTWNRVECLECGISSSSEEIFFGYDHKPLPASVSDDTAFHDRWAAYLPGWELPKLTPELLTSRVGFILDYTSEVFHRELRRIGHYGTLWEQWFDAPAGEWSARDRRSINRTFSGLTKLIFPAGTMEKHEAEPLLRLAIEMRLRIRRQLHTMSPREFPLTRFSYDDRETGRNVVVELADE